MTRLINFYLRVAYRIEHRLGSFLMPTLARFVFAALFAVYYWNSALAKIGDDFSGLWQPSARAFAQIYPKLVELPAFDIATAGSFQKAMVLAGTWAELVLPVLIIAGLFTRFAAGGMVVFVAVQTATDLLGHGLIDNANSLGAWFDDIPDSIIMDQRALWFMLLLILVFRGAGPLSIDELIKRRLNIY